MVTFDMRLNLYLLIVAIGFGCMQGFSQPLPENNPSTFKHYPFYLNKKKLWGYADNDGNLLIKPQFVEVKGFFKGFAPAKGKTGWGIINEKAEWIIQPQFDAIECEALGDYFVLTRNLNRTIKYVGDGRLLDEPSNNDAMVAFEVPSEDIIEKKTIQQRWTKREIRRYFSKPFNAWRIGEFFTIPGKPDSIGMETSFPFRSFSEPISKSDNVMVSWHKSDDGTKSGLLAWTTNEWRMDFTKAEYDSIWPCTFSNPTFYGKKGDKVAIINFDTRYKRFYESPAQFDEIKDWSTVYYLIRVRNEWFRLKNFGFYIPSRNQVKTEIDPEFLIKDVDDILPSNDPSFYYYSRNNLVGILFNRNHHDASNRKGDWFNIPAQFKTATLKEYWFSHSTLMPEYQLFDVTLPNGKSGPVTTGGILLFK